jgi:Uma2 family endonuclease
VIAMQEQLIFQQTAAEPQPLTLVRWTLEQYHEMIEKGLLSEDNRTELLEGWIVEKMGTNPPHSLSVGLASDALLPLLPVGWFLKIQDAMTTSDSQPEPDISIIRGNRRDFAEQHPSSPFVGLVIEVADSSLRQDRGIKKRIYARAGIPVYWIINLVDQQIEVYTRPEGERYEERRVYTAVDTVPVVLDGAEVGRLPARDLLP